MIRTRVAAMIIKDEKLLMLKGKGWDNLHTPGGGIEEGENDEQCLRRELKEEISVELVDYKFFKEYKFPSIKNPENTTIQRIYITTIKGEIKPDSEIESYLWLSKEEFLDNKYDIPPITKGHILPDLIKENIW